MSDRRTEIARLLRTSDRGWLFANEIADEIELDRSTVVHHAKTMVKEGTAALGYLRRVGESGHPYRVLVDPDRIPELVGTFEHTFPREAMHNGTRVTRHDRSTCEIYYTETPDEYVGRPISPVSKAIMAGHSSTEEMLRAASETIAAAVLADLRAGNLEVIIRTPPTTEETS